MKTLEFNATLDTESNLRVPTELAAQIPAREPVRLIVPLPKDQDCRDWDRLTAEQFLAGYSESDSIYDSL
jgi:hypothetical protein